MVFGQNNNKRRKFMALKQIQEEEEEKIVEGKDRISCLSDDLLCLILSSMDTKSAVQTTILSKRWLNVWKSVHKLFFLSSHFSNQSKFSNFVSEAVCRHATDAKVSEFILLAPSMTVQPQLLEGCLRYSMAYHAKEVVIIAAVDHPVMSQEGTYSNNNDLPLSILSSESVEVLLLASNLKLLNVPASSWDLPALNTLTLQRVLVGESFDLFSHLVNLKSLSLIDIETVGLKEFKIVSRKLETLNITANCFLKQIEACEYVISAPNLVEFSYEGRIPLRLCAHEQLSRLATVNIDIDYDRPKAHDEVTYHVSLLIDMFCHLWKAKHLIMSLEAADLLSCYPPWLLNYVSPFTGLEILTFRSRSLTTVSRLVVDYFMNASASVIVASECPHLYIDDLWDT